MSDESKKPKPQPLEEGQKPPKPSPVIQKPDSQPKGK